MNLGGSKFGGLGGGAPDVEVDYLLIGGGGAGNTVEGGGGAGGFISSYGTAFDQLIFTRGRTYTITIGAGGSYGGVSGSLQADGRWGFQSALTGYQFTGLVTQGGGESGYGSLNYVCPDTAKTFDITNVQKTNGTVRITTSSNHGLANFDSPSPGIKVGGNVHIRNVGGITQVNNKLVTEIDGTTPGIAWSYNVIDSTNIDLYSAYPIVDGNKIDTTGFGTYTSGGTLTWTVAAFGGSAGSGGAAVTSGGTYPGSDPYVQTSVASTGGYLTTSYAGGVGGGGGSSAAGGATDGGAGTANSITGSSVTYGAGGSKNTGTATTGYGDGGRAGKAGNNGVVILRINSGLYSGNTTGSPSVTTDSGFTILTYTSSGTYTA